MVSDIFIVSEFQTTLFAPLKATAKKDAICCLVY